MRTKIFVMQLDSHMTAVAPFEQRPQVFSFFSFFFLTPKPKINEGSSELNHEFVQADMMIKEEKT